jgi:hypothetical protein
MEHITVYRKVVRAIKGGTKRLEAANDRINLASIMVDERRAIVRHHLDELRALIPHVKVGG